MAKCTSSPSGRIKSPRNLQKGELAQRARTAQFIVHLEALMAWDYRLDRTDMVLKKISEHFLRDLPIPLSFPYSPYRLTHGASTEGAKTSARSAVMLNRILEARNWEKLLAQATPEEEAVLEACLPDLLQLQHERKEAQIRSSQAYNTMRRFRVTHRLMQRCYPAAEATPSQTRRVNAMEDLSVEARDAYQKARSAFEVADLMFRRARGFPLARRRNFNRRCYKLAPGRKRFRRWWERVRTRKPVSDLRKGFKRPPHWCDLCPGGLVYVHVAGAYAFGRVVPFSLNLTREMEMRARLKPLPAAWLRDQIARRVKQRLGHSVELLVGLELNKAGKLHAHGVMAPVRLIEEGEVVSTHGVV